MKLKVGDKFILQNKDVYTVNLQENNLPVLRADIIGLLQNKEVEINGEFFKVVGIELFATPEEFKHSNISVMVVPNETKNS